MSAMSAGVGFGGREGNMFGDANRVSLVSSMKTLQRKIVFHHQFRIFSASKVPCIACDHEDHARQASLKNILWPCAPSSPLPAQFPYH
jgi:hypothetical protein